MGNDHHSWVLNLRFQRCTLDDSLSPLMLRMVPSYWPWLWMIWVRMKLVTRVPPSSELRLIIMFPLEIAINWGWVKYCWTKPTLYFGQHLHGLKYVAITFPICSNNFLLYIYMICIYRANVFPMMFPKSSEFVRGDYCQPWRPRRRPRWVIDLELPACCERINQRWTEWHGGRGSLRVEGTTNW